MESAPAVDVVHRWICVDRIQTHYLTCGRGEPLLLLHGGGVTSAELDIRHCFGPLAGRFSLIAPDLPGYGRTDKPDVDYTTDFYIRFISRFCREIGLSHTSVLGLSNSGAFALGLTLDSPAAVEKLVLVGSYGLGMKLPKRTVITRMLDYFEQQDVANRAPGAAKLIIRKVLSAAIADKRAIDDSMVSALYEHVVQPGAGRAYAAWIRSETARNGYTDYSSRLSDLREPTLLIHGDEDTFIPVNWAIKAASLIPHARLVILPHCGHWPTWENPAALSQAVLDFI
ncbi:MAG: alpha/beta fold hydrolase [Candidatus Aquicultorales bacterium]